jgi:hypothetical protein
MITHRVERDVGGEAPIKREEAVCVEHPEERLEGRLRIANRDSKLARRGRGERREYE